MSAENGQPAPAPEGDGWPHNGCGKDGETPVAVLRMRRWVQETRNMKWPEPATAHASHQDLR
jgi:hypothetical protein